MEIINAINELKNEKDTIKARIVEIDQQLAEIRAAVPGRKKRWDADMVKQKKQRKPKTPVSEKEVA